MQHRGGTRTVVGREVELASVLRAATAAAAGSPSVLLVSGDAGIGKSSLVAEAAHRAAVPVYLGRCVQVGGEPLPLAPLVDLLRQIRRQPPSGATQSPSLDALSALTSPGGGPATSDALALTLSLVHELSIGDVLFFGIEDLHWGDAATWDLFEYLARNLIDERVVLVATYRPDELARDARLRRRLAELARLPGVERLVLHGLGREAVARHAMSLLGIPPPRALVDELVRRGEGNPFFTEELLAAHVAGEAIPPLLSELLIGDVESLDEPGRLVIAALAVIGRACDPRLLSTVLDVDEVALEAAVRGAVAARLIEPDAEAGTYRVRHALIGEVAYANLLPTERRRIHRAVADALGGNPELALAAPGAAGELAFHLVRAGDPAAAFGAALAAADEAVFMPSSALHHLEQALALWDHHGHDLGTAERIRRLWQAADLAAAVGDIARAVELATVALEAGPPPLGYAWGHERRARYLWTAGDVDASADEYRIAATLLEKEGDTGPVALAAAGVAQAELMFCRFDSAEAWATRVLSAGHDEEARSMALRVLGLVEVRAGEVEAGIAKCREALAVVEAPHRRALAQTYLVWALLDVGRFDEAVTLALDGAAAAQPAGLEASFGAYLLGQAAEGLLRLGRWQEADEVLARAESVDAIPVATITAGAPAAVLAARRGRIADADAARNRVGRHRADGWHEAVAMAAAAEAALALRCWKEALDALDAERGSSPLEARWPARAAALGSVARVELALDAIARREPVDGGAVATTELAELEPFGAVHDAVGAAHVAFARASVTRLTGPDPAAWEAAADAASRLGDPWLMAKCRMHEAAATVASGMPRRAVDALRAAHATASALGAQPLIDDIAAVSRRTRITVEAAPPATLDPRDVTRLGLTAREAEVLGLVTAGRTNREIGAALYVSEKTASVHVSNILRKLGVSSRVEAAAIADRLGLS